MKASDSEDSSSECDFEQSGCEIDSNSNDFDELPEGPMPRYFNHLDVAVSLSNLSISREKVQVSDVQIPTSDEFVTAQTADPELKQLRQ